MKMIGDVNIKNYIIFKLDNIYKNDDNLRFLYDIQFNYILNHLNNNYNIDSIKRYFSIIQTIKILLKMKLLL